MAQERLQLFKLPFHSVRLPLKMLLERGHRRAQRPSRDLPSTRLRPRIQPSPARLHRMQTLLPLSQNPIISDSATSVH